MAKPGRGSDQFPLRLPPGLRDRIKATAEASGRSMNTEIVSALEDAFPEPGELRVNLDFMERIDSIKLMLDDFRSALGEAGVTLADVEEIQKKQKDESEGGSHSGKYLKSNRSTDDPEKSN